MKKLLQVAAVALVASTAAANAKDTLTVSWWGYNGDVMKANIIKPFEEKYDVNVVFETGNNADRLGKLAARRGNGIDVIFLSDIYSEVGIEQGLFQKIDDSKIPNLDKIYEMGRDPQHGYGPAYTVGRIGIAYDSAKVKPITSWDDLWRSDLKDQVSLPGITTTAGPLFVVEAAKHAGVDAFKDEDAAFDAITAIKPNVSKNYNTGSEMVNLFSTGEASVTMVQDFTLKSLQDAVPTVKWADLKDGDIAVLNTVNIPVGAKHTDLAYKFINFLLSTEVQQKEAEQGADAPINKDVKLDPKAAALWTYGADAIAKLNTMDYSQINEAKSEWIDRWNEIFGM